MTKKDPIDMQCVHMSASSLKDGAVVECTMTHKISDTLVFQYPFPLLNDENKTW
jgi:hypothetical protein